ncbi:MAG: hypothetical protein EOO61_16780, partial [Hymenobacter sp.]
MNPNPIFLLGMTILVLCVPASAQTIPTPTPKTVTGKQIRHPKKAATLPHTTSMSDVKIDTAAFLHSGRPADAIINRVQDIPPY